MACSQCQSGGCSSCGGGGIKGAPCTSTLRTATVTGEDETGIVGCDISIFADQYGDNVASSPEIAADFQTVEDVPDEDPVLVPIEEPDEPAEPTQEEVLAETRRRSIIGYGSLGIVGILLLYLNRHGQL